MSRLLKKKSPIEVNSNVIIKSHKAKALSVEVSFTGDIVSLYSNNVTLEFNREDAKALYSMLAKALDIHNTNYYDFN